jgi:anti-sigma factor (TIGR02949 family)
MNPADTLSCEEVLLRLDDYVDRELTADEMRLVHEHLETCVRCAGEYAFEASVIDVVRDVLRRVEVPNDLRERVWALLTDEHSRRPNRWEE